MSISFRTSLMSSVDLSFTSVVRDTIESRTCTTRVQKNRETVVPIMTTIPGIKKDKPHYFLLMRASELRSDDLNRVKTKKNQSQRTV